MPGGLSAVSCAARHGDSADSLASYGELIAHWQRAGAWNQQGTTIRTLIETLTRRGRHESAAVLHGAMTASGMASPLVGLDAARIAQAVEAMRGALGADRFTALQADGAELGDVRPWPTRWAPFRTSESPRLTISQIRSR